MKLQYKIHGLKGATKEEIQTLIKKFPYGEHRTHTKSGDKLPYNGVFFERRPL